MKYHEVPPRFMIAEPVDSARHQVSRAQWTVLGLQALPVMSAEAGPLARNTLSLARMKSDAPRAMALWFTSVTASMPSRSIHWRMMFTPTSVFCWWSAATTSTLMPRWSTPESATAWRTQATAVSPLVSR